MAAAEHPLRFKRGETTVHNSRTEFPLNQLRTALNAALRQKRR
jgi:hypothetical protein